MAALPLANGVIIDTETGQAIGPSPSADNVKTRIEREKHSATLGRDKTNRAVRIGIAELPADPRAITTVGVVWMYYSLGLSDFDIKDATGLTLSQIDSIKGLKLFEQIQTSIIGNLTKLNEEDVHTRIAALAPRMLDEMEDIVGDNEVEAQVRARIAGDLLDRAGYAPKQITEHRHKVEGGLLIRYVSEDRIEPKNIPEITIDRNGATDA